MLASGTGAWATHEVHHRYTISGHVRDDAGRPMSDVQVAVKHIKSGGIATAVTRRDGTYSILLHLHNTNMGDQLEVSTAEETKKLRASFDPEDQQTERKAQVDFGAPPAASSDAGDRSWWIGLGAIAVLGSGLWWRRHRGRARRAGQARRHKGEGTRS